MIDGKAVASCDVLLGDVSGAQIETAEGLDVVPVNPLVDAFLDHQAGQCGYCLPGILMAAKALLDVEPLPSRARIVQALAGNLCRCGAHVRILDAVEAAALKWEGQG